MDRVLRGGHLGDAWGSSPWTASTLDPATPTIVGSLNLFQPYDPFAETGSFFEGLQAGYNYLQRYFVRRPSILAAQPRRCNPTTRFAGSQTANRLVLTVGRFAIVDLFDTNKYANNPKSDFLNWSLVNTGTFDYAADGWGFTYGAAAEWYQGPGPCGAASSICRQRRPAG